MSDLPVPTTADIRTMKGAARKVAVAQRKAAVAVLLDKGRTLREAAAELGLTFGQVASVSRALIRDSEETYREHRDRLNARLLRQNRVFQRECWEHLDRAKLGHIRQEVEDFTQVATQTTPAKSNATPTKRRTIRENDLMAEARILETLRKAQVDEAKILGWTPPEEKSTEVTVNDQRSIIIINDANVPISPWVASIRHGVARQGVGVLPPGTTDAEIEAVVLQTKEADLPEVSQNKLTEPKP
jgi:hypothetical protein